MVEELKIVMEPLSLLNDEEIVVTITKEAESLTPLVLRSSTTYEDLRKKVLKICKMRDVHMLYINDDGDAVNLDSSEEFIKAWEQAFDTKQLHIMAQPPLQTPPTHSKKSKHTNPYAQLAACISEDRRQRCEKAGKSLLEEEKRQQNSEESADRALLGKLPCEGGDNEPFWFNQAMEKYTDKVVKAITEGINGAVVSSSLSLTTPTSAQQTSGVVHEGIVCDGCEKELVGIRYKCGNCSDYDLCEGCEQLSSFIHPEDHAFIKIKRPARYAGVNRKGKRKPLLKRSVYSTPTVVLMPAPRMQEPVKTEEHRQQSEGASGKTSEPPTRDEEVIMIRKSKEKLREELRGHRRGHQHHYHHHRHHRHHDDREEEECQPLIILNSSTGFEPSEEMIKKTRKQLKREAREAKQRRKTGAQDEEKKVSAQEKEEESCSTTTSDKPTAVVNAETEGTSTATSINSTNVKGHGKCLSGSFVEDTSYPDDTIVYYGKPFTKGWIIENTGTKTWKKVKLVYQNGFQPKEQELAVPELEPGQKVELVVEYPPVTLSDGVEIKSSWRLIHDGHTPFGDTLWLSVIGQPDPTEELSSTFELITYPSLPSVSGSCEGEEHEIPESVGFTHSNNCSQSVSSSCKTGDGYTLVESPTPVLSLASNDSLFQTNEDVGENEEEEEANGYNQCYDSNDEDEFVVIIPDCFKLDVPLTGFDPPVTEPLSPIKTTAVDFSSSASSVTTDVVSPLNTSTTTSSITPPIATPITASTTSTQQQVTSEVPQMSPPSSNDSPATARKKGSGLFGRDTLDACWTSRTRNPFRYAVGVVNTVADLVETHVHFVSQNSETSETTTVETTEEEEEEEDENNNIPQQDGDSPKPSAPPLQQDGGSPKPSAPPLPSPPTISDITCQERDISRFVNRKWDGPKPAETPMDQLISMGFANRDLNSRLLKKHKNNLQSALQELLDTNGDGYQ